MTGTEQKEWLTKREAEDVGRAIAARLANPAARPDASASKHVQVTDCLREGKVSVFCSCNHCTLAVCSVCGAYEGGLTTECPGERVDFDTTQAVYTTGLDYTTAHGWYIGDQGMRERSPAFA